MLLFYAFQVFFQNHLGIHHSDLLKEHHLIGTGQVHLIFVLAFAPPFIETHRVVLVRDLGKYARAVTRKIYHQAQTHKPLVIVGISTPELADKRIENFKGIDLKHLLLDYHLVYPDRIHVEPGA